MANSLARDPNLRKLVRQIRSARAHPFRLKHLLAEYELKYGEEAEDAVLEIVAEDTERVWAGIAHDRGSNSIDDLMETLWKRFEQSGGEYKVEGNNGIVQVTAMKCPIADIYKKIGKAYLGEIFHCSTDAHIVRGFNDSIQFSMTKTLMAGDDCCNHCYMISSE